MAQNNRLLFLYLFFAKILCVSAADATVTIDAQQLKDLIAETRALRQEVAQLKQQINHAPHSKHSHQAKAKRAVYRASPSSKHSVPKTEKTHKKASIKQQTDVKQSTAAVTKKPSIFDLAKIPVFSNYQQPPIKTNFSKDVLHLGGGAVLIEPDTGFPSLYNGADLLANLVSWSNADLLVLQYRKGIESQFSKQSQDRPNYYVVLSGALGGVINYTQPYIGDAHSDVDLSTASLTSMIGVGKWVTGLIDTDYYNYAPATTNPPQYGTRSANSRVFVDQAYITVGNLSESPFYATLGQMTVPFGSFYSYSITGPLTAALFAIKERPILLGYSKSTGIQELDIEVYGYQGETVFGVDREAINEWGASADYLLYYAYGVGNVGVGYISNIADSGSMQANGQNQLSCELFNGFAFPCRSSNLLKHRVPAFDVHLNASFGHWNLDSEYITALRPFAPIDMTFDGKAASPKAYDIELGYLFNFFNKPSSLSMGYSGTQQAIATLLPMRAYTYTFITSFWPRTQQSFGYQRGINYPPHTTAVAQTGQNVIGPVFQETLGRHSDLFLFSMYITF